MHTHARNEEPKQKVSKINSQTKKQEIGIQVIFILKISLQKFLF